MRVSLLNLVWLGMVSSQISEDVAYLHAVASVHEWCADDFDIFCGPEKKEHSGRRLSLMMVSMSAVVETDDESVGTSKGEGAPLGLGPYGDKCLRDAWDSLSAPCTTAISLADATKPQNFEHFPPGGPPPPFLGCGFPLFGALLFIFILLLAFKKHKKYKAITKIFSAIRNDPELKARVEKAADTKLPQPCCNTDKKRNCCRHILSAFSALLAGYVLTLLLGPFFALIFVWLVLVPLAVVNHYRAKKAKKQASTEESVQSVGSYVPPEMVKVEEDSHDDTTTTTTTAPVTKKSAAELLV
eukprot:CAMPEP_0197287688 /NCGR_PEP_ID=MMETSP0890-20130614/4305_1 /TAXON_ID=44058 ORGANISM="Aureoumbra lagunensis, Strain CCMP1510" /NCGR_SAMPLE_ID=MMETSP0890 /ASSEMBLY_ACC=CAM_ASM_000533 /LENGTH=298 /DNA_ID=CAMNT_0042757657 /DNA_START=46 /DNA_END=942 /DNA_ORIENTATION=-